MNSSVLMLSGGNTIQIIHKLPLCKILRNRYYQAKVLLIEIVCNLFTSIGVPYRRVKSSGIRQSKIYEDTEIGF